MNSIIRTIAVLFTVTLIIASCGSASRTSMVVKALRENPVIESSAENLPEWIHKDHYIDEEYQYFTGSYESALFNEAKKASEFEARSNVSKIIASESRQEYGFGLSEDARMHLDNVFTVVAEGILKGVLPDEHCYVKRMDGRWHYYTKLKVSHIEYKQMVDQVGLAVKREVDRHSQERYEENLKLLVEER